MLTVLLGGAPGVGKSAAARELLRVAAKSNRLVQWVDVDNLWMHQPWRVDEPMKSMVQGNLRAVLANANLASVDILVVTWVFQTPEMHALVEGLVPAEATVVSIQLHAEIATWRGRYEQDPERPPIDGFFESRYTAAQATAVDHTIDTDGLDPMEVAGLVSLIIGL